MHLAQRRVDRQQVVLGCGRPRAADRRRRSAKWVTRPVDATAQLALGQAGGQRVDGHQAAGVDRRAVAALVVGVVEDQLAALLDQSAAERDGLAGLDAQARDAVAQPDGVDACRVASGRWPCSRFSPRGRFSTSSRSSVPDAPSLRPGRTARRSARRVGTPGGATGSGRAGRGRCGCPGGVYSRARTGPMPLSDSNAACSRRDAGGGGAARAAPRRRERVRCWRHRRSVVAAWRRRRTSAEVARRRALAGACRAASDAACERARRAADGASAARSPRSRSAALSPSLVQRRCSFSTKPDRPPMTTRSR